MFTKDVYVTLTHCYWSADKEGWQYVEREGHMEEGREELYRPWLYLFSSDISRHPSHNQDTFSGS